MPTTHPTTLCSKIILTGCISTRASHQPWTSRMLPWYHGSQKRAAGAEVTSSARKPYGKSLAVEPCGERKAFIHPIHTAHREPLFFFFLESGVRGCSMWTLFYALVPWWTTTGIQSRREISCFASLCFLSLGRLSTRTFEPGGVLPRLPSAISFD